MLHKMFTVYDSKSEFYLQPFFMPAKGAALRAFADSVLDKSHQFGKYPEDFTLFEIGEYDDKTAVVTTLPCPISLGVAIEFVK